MDGVGFPEITRLQRRSAPVADAAPRLRTGLIGAGSFGAHHAGKLAAAPLSRFVGVYDRHVDRAETIAAKHGVGAFADLAGLLHAVDAVIIASPASTHAAIAAKALEAGVHVLVEKPLAASAAEADRLVQLSHRHGCVLQAGHQERFVMDALGLFRVAEAPFRVESVRENSPNGRGLDVSVTLDVMIHDLDLIASMYGASPLSIQATGRGAPGLFDEVQAVLTFAAGQAYVRASRIATERRRTMRAHYAIGVADIDFAARTVSAPAALGLDPAFADKVADPLGSSVTAFLDACAGRGPCSSPGEAGAAAVRLACAIDAACMDAAQAA